MANLFQKIFKKNSAVKEESVTPTQQSGSLKDRFSSIFKRKEPKEEKPFSLVKETIKGLGKKETYKKAYDIGFKSSIKQILNTPKDVLQGTARSGAIAGVTAIGADKVPESKFSKILFGEKPVENVKGSIRNTKADLEKMGISPKLSSLSAAPLVLGSIAADLSGGGGAKKAAQEALTNKNVVKPIAKLISGKKAPINKLVKDDKNLIAMHNLSEDNLRYTDKVGGLPVPSLAVARKEYPIDSFGEVSLIGNKDLIDPRNKTNKAFNADVYSKRSPQTVVDVKNIKPIEKTINESKDYFDNLDLPEWRNDNSPYTLVSNIESNGLRGMKYDFVMQRAFGASKKISPKSTRMEIEDFANANKREYDDFVENIYNQIEPDEKIFKGFTNSGRRRYVPASLENFVKEMKGSVQDTEGFGYGVPSLRASQAKKFNSLEAIKKDRNKIIPKEEMEALGEETIREFDSIVDKYPDIPSLNSLLSNLKDFTKNKISRSNFMEWSKIPSEAVDELVVFAKKLKDMPTGYFEVKPQRAVGINEFKIAVIPKNASLKTREILERKGLTLREYDPKLPNDRARAIREAAEEEDLVFKLSKEKKIAYESTVKDIRSDLKRIFGKNVPIKAIDDVALMSDPRAVGELSNGVIKLLTDNGKVSDMVGKHEAWHLFKRVLASKEERLIAKNIEDNLIKAFPNKYKKLEEVGYSKNRIAEELVADEFARYYRTGKTLTEKIKVFFDKVLQRYELMMANKGELLTYFKNIRQRVGAITQKDIDTPSFKLNGENPKPVSRLIAEGKVRIVRRGDKDVYQVKQGKNWANARDEESAVKRILSKETPKKQPLTLEQEEQRVLLELQREELNRNPAKGLTRFMNKRAGELPEVGAGKGVFAKKGDEMADSLGFEDSEAARAEAKNFLKNKEDLLAREKEFKQSLKLIKETPQTKLSEPKLDIALKEAEDMGIKVNLIDKKPSRKDMMQGKYKQGEIVVFTKDINGKSKDPQDILNTLYHEMGHDVDYKRRGIIADPMGDSIRDFDGTFRAYSDGDTYFRSEYLKKEADAIRKIIPRKDSNATTQKEVFADAFRLFKTSPDELKQSAPNIYKMLDDYLKTDKTPTVKEFQVSAEKLNTFKQSDLYKKATGQMKPDFKTLLKKPKRESTLKPIKETIEEIKPTIKKEIYTPEKRAEFDVAQKKINDVAINKQERVRMVNNAKNVRSQTPVPTLGGKIKQSLDPVKYLDQETQTIFKERNNAIIKARKLADEEARTIKTPGGKEGYDTIIKYQKGEATPFSGEIKEKFDTLFKEANDRTGKTIAYRENYIPQAYQESPTEIAAKISDYLATEKKLSIEEIQDYMAGKPLSEAQATRLKLNPTFSKERTFPNYEIARQYGLTPKYTTVSQLAGYYREELETTVANRKFIDSLVEKGKILPLEDAPKDWKAVNLPFSTKGYYAEPQLARTINGLFPDEADKGFREALTSTVANISKRAQEIALSAGFPKSNVNFFSIGQLVKEMTAGNFNAIGPFLRANFNEKSIKYFEKNQEYLKKMADQGIDLGDTVASYKTTYKPIFNNKTFREKIGDGFDKLFNEKTFGSFLPQMHLQSFKSIYDSGIKKGLSEKQAEKLAGDTVKKAFGMSEYSGRGKSTEDALSAVFFAPKFREGILNTLANTGKSGIEFVRLIGGLRGKLDPAYKKNRKLLAGMIVTYAAYNALNKELNGNYMWDNPDNRKFALQIPRENGELIYVEFMPSFLAFARNLASGAINLASGDIKGAQQKFGSLFSMPVKITTEILANRDYFGNAIYKDTDRSIVKALKIAKYTGLQVNHPYVKEIINQLGDKKPLYQSVITALELPLKFSTKEKVAKQEFYKELDKVSAEKAKDREKMMVVYEDVQKLIAEEKLEEAQRIVDNLSEEDYEIYKGFITAAKRKATIDAQIAMYDTVKKIRQLKAEGREEEGLEIINNMTDEEYEIYVGAAKKLNAEKVEAAEKKGIKLAIDYARAYAIDPGNAFKAMFTKEVLGDVEGKLVQMERFYGNEFNKEGGSEEYVLKLLEEMGIPASERSNYNLEHIVPVGAGGDTSPENLKIIDRETHNSWKSFDTKLSKAVRDGDLSRKKAAEIARDFKNGRISLQEAEAKIDDK